MRFGIISDPHISPPDVKPYLWHNTVDLPRSVELIDAALEWLGSQEIDILVLLGDLTEAADAESFALVQARAEAFGVPVLAVPGNCDVDPIDRTVTTFEQIAGNDVMIASAILPYKEGIAIELIGLQGEMGSKDLSGVRAGSATAATQIVLTHYPVLDFESELATAGFKHSGNLTNRAEIESDLRASGIPTVVIHGHLHMHEARISGSLLHLSCAALIEPPHHVSVIEVTAEEAGLMVERWTHSVRAFEVERLPVFATEHGCWSWADGAWSPQSGS